MTQPSKWKAGEPGGGSEAERFYRRYWRYILDSGYHNRPAPARIGVALELVHRHARDHERLVDVGCADGKLGRALGDLEMSFGETIGLDISPEALELAGPDYSRVARWDATTTDLADVLAPGSASVVTCLDVLEHLFDPGRAVSQFRRALRPDGLLVISTPNFAHWRSRTTVLRGAFPSDDQHIFHEADHLHYFTAESFKALVRDHGYQVLELRGTNFQLPAPLARLDNGLKGRLGRSRPTLFARQMVLAARPDNSS